MKAACHDFLAFWLTFAASRGSTSAVLATFAFFGVLLTARFGQLTLVDARTAGVATVVLARDDDFSGLFNRSARAATGAGEDALDFFGFGDVGDVVLLDDARGSVARLSNFSLGPFLLAPLSLGDFLNRARVYRG